ncbi:STE24 endopeptidase [Blastomyces silverae]|uniref:STE24 endopeptidase n=1 Tax=Blastomyces silverae TaxID=2060906 RepID=A0A0H1BCP9_9EURO|nr:STE24 endopeptidase [Blastomyces silverae]
MPTPLDKALNSKNLFLGFAGLVTAAAAWTIWGGDMFPAEPDPTGNPENWSIEELRRWLSSRGLLPSSAASREDLIERVKANLRHPRR